jgi:hypothetical protein
MAAQRITYSINRRNDKGEKQGGRILRSILYFVPFVLLLLCFSHIFFHLDFEDVTQSTLPPGQKPEPIALTKTSSSRFLINTVVLPSVVNPNTRTKRLDSITATWATPTNAIYVTHPGTDSDYSLPSSSPKYPQIMQIPSNIATGDEGVPRLKYVIEQVYKEYNPDFCFFANDHTFIIPEHLMQYLDEIKADPNRHLYAGHAMKPKNQHGTQYAFNSGASGYFLSRKTMQQLVEKWNSKDEVCEGSGRKWLQGNPGLLTAECLKSMGVDPVDSRDAQKRHVFHAFGLVRVVKNSVDEWYHAKHEELNEILGEDELYHHALQKGEACCSSRSASFHYVEAAETMALWATLEEVRNHPEISDEMLRKFMLDHWPQEKSVLGFYSQPLPPLKEEDTWSDLLHVVRNIAN